VPRRVALQDSGCLGPGGCRATQLGDCLLVLRPAAGRVNGKARLYAWREESFSTTLQVDRYIVIACRRGAHLDFCEPMKSAIGSFVTQRSIPGNGLALGTSTQVSSL
jgi:hypothetical protein